MVFFLNFYFFTFLVLLKFFNRLNFFLGDFFFGFFSNLLRSLLKVTKVTTDHQKWPEVSNKKKHKSSFLPKGQKILGHRPKPSEGGRSKPT